MMDIKLKDETILDIHTDLDRRDTYKHEKYGDYWPDEYDNELRDNWNTYCETGDTEVFNRKRAKILEEQDIKIW